MSRGDEGSEATAASGRIAVVGSTNADLIVRTQRHPRPGETLLGEDLDTLPGGKGANQAVAAARLGAAVQFVGAVGRDAFAAVARDGMRAAGVDVSALTEVDGPTGTAVITVDAAGENSIVVVPGANGAVDAARVEQARETVAAADVVVLQGEIPAVGSEAAARACTGRLMLNLAPVIAVDPAVLRRADPLVVNEHEAARAAEMLGAFDEGAGPGPEHAEPDAVERGVVERLLAAGVPSVVLTVGPRGAWIGAGSAEPARVPAPTVHAVDTTGAGDAFVGALAVGLVRGEALAAAARRAVRVGAFAVGRRGAQPSYPAAEDPLPGG
ncbi:ribokinase [Nesterenkonia sp. F]|uniref:ribokinase n=1 Tax=Nesterenkonia sp. F TaxID=795955 RepID=UPI000255D198|nr:ribokinase [Nesterenkonia sp. F]